MFSVSNSLVFLLSVRNTLRDFVDASKGLNEPDKKNLKNFFINEGTDYEIMHFFLRGSFPEKRYDSVIESELYEQLRSDIRKNFIALKKFIDEETIKSVITEVAPITSKGLSSSAVMVELIASGNVNLREQEQALPDWKKGAAKIWGRVSRLPGAIRDTLQKSAQQGKIHSITSTFSKHKRELKVIGVALALTLLTVAAYRIYKNKISAAGRACKQYTGPEKDYCMRKFKLEALKSQVDALKSALSSCGNTSDPEKCKSVLNNKIKKLEERISRLSKQV